MTMNENEPVAFLVTWTDKDGNEWVHAHASEGTAFDQSQQKNGILQPLYTHPAPAVAQEAVGEVVEEKMSDWCKPHASVKLFKTDFKIGRVIYTPPVPAVAAICPTCGEIEPKTGNCGTSDSDNQALCKKAPSVAPAEVVRELVEAANKALSQLTKLSSFMQCDAQGNGPDCTDYFQAQIDLACALKSAKEHGL